MALYSPLFMRWKMRPVKIKLHHGYSLQEEFAPFWDLRRTWWRGRCVEFIETSRICVGGTRRLRLTRRGGRWSPCLRGCWQRDSVRRTMFDGMKHLEGISPLKRRILSVWCDALAHSATQVESLRARAGEFPRHPSKNDGAGRQNLYKSSLSQAFARIGSKISTKEQ